MQLKGNIRELENVLTRILFYSSGTTLDKRILVDVDITYEPNDNAINYNDNTDSKILPIWKIEKMAIENAFKIHRRNLSKVATALEISRSSLYRKLKKYGLEN